MHSLSKENILVSAIGAILSASLFLGAAVSGAPVV